jgi:hypothetical protein
MQSRHGFRKSVNCINVVIINGNYKKKNKTKPLVRVSNKYYNELQAFVNTTKEKLPSGDRGGGQVSDVIPPASASLARLFTSSHWAL